MRQLHTLIGLLRFALKRQWHHPGLTVLGLLRVVFAVGLITSAAFFSNAVQRVILDQLLKELSEVTGRPPFSALIYTFPSARQPISVQAAEDLEGHVASTLSSEVGLPIKHVGLQVGSGAMSLLPKEGSSLYAEGQSSLGVVSLVYIDNVEDYIANVAGDPLGPGVSGEALDVWMHAQLAAEMGVQVGDEFNLSLTSSDTPLPVRVRGIWQARDPTEPFWFTNPENTLQEALLVRRGGYVGRVEPLLPSKTRQVFWHVILDEDAVNPANARDYVYGFERGTAIINKFVPDAQLNASPLGALEKFVRRETVLTTILLSFNVPSFGFLLYYLVLTSAIIARWQQRDTASLVSRGMSNSGILSLAAIDELILFIIGFPLGIGFGMVLARLMGYTSSFLSFVERPALPVTLQGINWLLVLVALTIALIARVLPSVRASRQSVVTFDQERARPVQAPFWHRYYLDILFIPVTLYVYSQLSNTGTLGLLVQDRPEDLYRDPLLILVPALFILAIAMLTVRLLRLVMRAADFLANAIPWITPHMVLRRLSRQSPEYMNPLLLIMVALAVGVYTLSMAASLDQWLYDRLYYRVGADIAFEPLPPVSTDGAPPPDDGGWIPLPDEFAALPGVEAATSVGDYRMRFDVSFLGRIGGRFLAIDRVGFPTVAWFRRDFADESLGALMNRLAQVPDGILVSKQVLEQNHWLVGDKVSLIVAASQGLVLNVPFTVAGSFDYFPTVYEDEEIAIIGNLDYLSTVVGAPLPHNLWLRTQRAADGKAVLSAVSSLGIGTTKRQDTRALIAQEQANMDRVGVFGTLSVGFLAAIVMAAIALLLYSYASLRERLYRFAVLRAMGLKRRQIVSQVILEYTLLTACGAVIGAFVGMAASDLFVPFFRITGEQGIVLPSLIPVIAEQDTRVLVVAFAVAMVLLEMIVIARALSWRQFRLLRGGDG